MIQIAVGRARYHSGELTPDGREVLVGGFEGVRTYDVATGKVVREYRAYEGHVVWAARMTLDGARVVAGNGGGRLDIWNAKTRKRRFELETDDAIVTRLSLSRDGKRAVTAAGNRILRFWDLEHGKSVGVRVEKKSFVIAAAIAPSGDVALHGGTDGVVRLFDCASQKEIATATGKGWIESIQASADGRFFISAGRDKTVMIWNAKNLEPVRTLRGFTRTITCADISADGSRVVATGGGVPLVWNTKNGEVLGKLDAPKCWSVRFSHDGASIVTVDAGVIGIHDTP